MESLFIGGIKQGLDASHLSASDFQVQGLNSHSFYFFLVYFLSCHFL